MLAALKQLQDSLPPQVLLQKPVIFTDALDRIAPVHLEWITSWESFLVVLEIRFKDLGRSKIRRQEFTLRETATRRTITFFRPLDVSLMPGQYVEMSMVFRDDAGEYQEDVCPHCHLDCYGAAEEDMEWYADFPGLFFQWLTCKVFGVAAISAGQSTKKMFLLREMR